MKYKLINLSGYPLDVSTLNGPAILPANGTLIADLGPLDAEIMKQSPLVQIDETKADKAK